MKELVSIVVPVYNAERTLARCIDSLINQDYNNKEIILVNDGSTDNSQMICDHYKRKCNQIRIINKTNAGVSSARNAGISVSMGTFMVFVDADDYVDTSYLSRLVSKQKEIDADIVFSGYYKEFGNKVEKIYLDGFETKEITGLGAEVLSLFLKNCLNPPWGKLYKKRLLDNLIFEESISLGEDILFNISYLNNCHSACTVKESLYHYIISKKGSLHSRFSEADADNYYSIWKSTREYFSNYKYKDLELASNYRLLVNTYGFFEGLYRTKHEHKSEIIHKIIKQQKDIFLEQNKRYLGKRLNIFRKLCLGEKVHLLDVFFRAMNVAKKMRV